MRKLNLKIGLIALTGLGISANVSAADYTCSDITFTPEAFAAYEFVDKACLDIVDRNGVTFAKMTTTVIAQAGVSTFVRFTHSDGIKGPRYKANLGRNFQTMIGGKPVRIADLNPGQEVNVYVSKDLWAAPAPKVAEVVKQAVKKVAPPPPPKAKPAPEPKPKVLPTTAGLLPTVALLGSLFLLLGGALRLSRKQ